MDIDDEYVVRTLPNKRLYWSCPYWCDDIKLILVIPLQRLHKQKLFIPVYIGGRTVSHK